LKCVIRLPSALKVMMSTPLILTPSISFSNSSTAVVAAPFADIPEAGAAQHLSRARQVLERDLTPALRREYDGALEHGVGMQQVPQRFMVVRLHVVAPLVEGGHPHISGGLQVLPGNGPIVT